MKKTYLFKGLDSGDTTKVTIEDLGNEMESFIKAEAEAVFNLCEEVEEIDENGNTVE